MGGGAAPVLCVEKIRTNQKENDYQLFVVRDLIHPSTFGPKQARSSPSVNSKKKKSRANELARAEPDELSARCGPEKQARLGLCLKWAELNSG
jgi:hypothetical protein